MGALAAAALVLSGLPMAGLAAPPALAGHAQAAPVPQGPRAAGQSLPWDLLGCFYAVAVLPVETSTLRPWLPEGFRARTTGPRLPAPSPVEGVSLLGVEVDVCREGAGLAGRVPDMRYGSMWVGALPPAHLEVEGYDEYYVVWDVLVPDADRRAVLQGAGVPARDGAVAVRELLPGLASDAREVELALEGLGTFRSTIGGAPLGALPLAGRFVQFHDTGQGTLARWRTDYETLQGDTGAGTFEAAPGSWLEDLVGQGLVPARFLYGTWDYTGGLIELGLPG